MDFFKFVFFCVKGASWDLLRWNEGIGKELAKFGQILSHLLTFLHIARVYRWQTIWSTILHDSFRHVFCVETAQCSDNVFGGMRETIQLLTLLWTIKKQSKKKKREIWITKYHRLYLHFDCFLLTSETILWMLCVPPGTVEFECSQWYLLLSTSSGDCLTLSNIPTLNVKEMQGHICQHLRLFQEILLFRAVFVFFLSSLQAWFGLDSVRNELQHTAPVAGWPLWLLEAACVQETVENSGIVASASRAKKPSIG